MPWEKSFDVDDVLDRAAHVFWAKGYEAASIADLIDGMGINKGSLYNAFGSKKELFKQVLIKFRRDTQDAMLAQLDDIDDPVGAIATFFDSIIAQSMTDGEKKGCLIINTALELPRHDEEVREIIRGALDNFEDFFRRKIEQGQKRGVVSKDIHARDTAKSLTSFVVAIRVLARGAFTAEGLVAIKKDAVRLVAA